MLELELPKIGIGTLDDPYRTDWKGNEEHEPNLFQVVGESDTIIIVRVYI